MGSYLTIVNDTPDTWQCKIGPDTAVLKFSAILFGAIAAALTALAVVGAALAMISIVFIPLLLGFELITAATATTIISGLPFASLVAGSGTAAAATGAGAAAATGAGAAAATGAGAAAAATTGAVGIEALAGAAAAGAATVGGVSAVGASLTGTVGSTAYGMAMAESIKNKLTLNGYTAILPKKSHRFGRMTLSLWQQGVCMKTKTKGRVVIVDTVTMRPIFSGSTADSNRDYEIQHWIDKRGIKSNVIAGRSGRGNIPVRSLEENDEQIQTFRFFPNGTAYNVATGATYLS